MPSILENIDPVELTEFGRLARDDFDSTSQSLARFLPYREVGDIRYAYSRGVEAIIDLAEFRAFDAESQLARRPAGARVTGELLPISRKIPLAEYDNLRLRNADQEIEDGVFNDAENLARSVAARIEVGRGQLLQTGKVSLNENGVIDEYDSGRASGHTITAITDNWDDPDEADPIADVIDWADMVEAATGFRPDTLLVSPAVMVHLQQAEKVRGALIPAAMAPAYTTQQTVQDAFAQIAGVTIEVRRNIPGLAVKPIDDDWVVLLASNVPLGSSLWGVTLESQEPAYQGLSPQPGLVAGAWKSRDPINVWTHVAAIALPILTVPDATLSAKVK